MADRNKSEGKLIFGRVLPNIDAAIKNTCKLMDAQDYISGQASDFDRYFRDQLENGMYQVEQYYEDENINEIVEDSPTYVFKIPVLPYLEKPNVQIAEHDGKAEITFISNDSTSELRYTFGNREIRKGYEKKYVGPFTLNKSTMLNVQAFADGFLSSQVVTVPVNILDQSHGLIRQTYEGQWENCDQMLDSDFVEEKMVFSLGLDAEKKNNFGHVFKGMIYIEKRGTYEFQTTSDDGSRLFINGFPVVDNDGLHGRKTISGDIVLKKGLHAVKITL